MSCSKPLVPLCGQPFIPDRDGYTGANAKLYVPWLNHYYFFDGTIRTFPGSTALQSHDLTMNGQTKPANYAKSCCDCDCSGSLGTPVIG